MQLLWLRLENVRSYPKARLEFPKGIVMLSGDIGSGKSTVLLAIEFALFGLLRGEISGAALLRNGAMRGSVELAFKIDENLYVVRRSLKRSKDAVEQEAGYLIANGVKMDGTAIELKSKVLELLGYPAEQLTKAKNLIYRYTLYTPQEEMRQILQENKEERLALLRKVFAIDKYASVMQNANVYAKALRERKRALDIVLGDLEEKRKLVKQIKNDLEITCSARQKCEGELEHVRKEVGFAREKLQEAETQKAQTEMLKSQVYSIQAKVSAQEAQIKSQAQEIALLTRQESTLAHPAHNAPKVSSQELSKGILANELVLRSYAGKVAQVSVLNMQSKLTVQKISALAQCPTCLQGVSLDHKAHIVKREEKKIKDAQEEEAQIKENAKMIDAELVELRSRLELVRKEEQEVALAQMRKSQAQNIIQRKTALLSNQAMLETDIETQKKRLVELDEQIKSRDETKYEVARKVAETVLQAERKASIEHASIVQKEIQIGKQLEIVAKDVEVKERGKKQLERTQNVHQWIVDYFIPLMEVIEKHVMARIHHEFNILFQTWFSMLVEDVMTARLDESFTPVIQQNGYDIAIEHLSGGERTACALAYRLALNKTINAIMSSIRTKDLLILDEPTEGFSGEQLDKMRDVISQLGLGQIIIVSHEQKVEGFADKVIRLEKTQNGTQVVS